MNHCYHILAVRIINRAQNALAAQAVLTEYGCLITTRLGLHEGGGDSCSPDGLIILQLCGEQAQIDEFVAKLGGLEGVRAKYVSLD